MRLIFVLFIFLISAFNFFFASSKEDLKKSTIDMPYSDLEVVIKNLDNEPENQWGYVQIFIAKAKRDNNIAKIRRGYVLASFNRSGSEQIRYSDSVVFMAKKIGDIALIGDSYLSLGMSFSNNENYPRALDSFLSGYDYISKTGDPYLIHNAEYQIAQTKSYLGQFKEANALLQSSVSFFRNNHKTINETDYKYYYLYALIALIDSNSRIGNFTQNIQLIDEGKKFIKNNPTFHSYYPYLLSCEAVNSYYEGKNDVAISQFLNALKLYNDKWKHLTDKYYLGMSYWNLGKKEEAITYFLLLDKEYASVGKIDPQFRPAFEKLIQYYQEKGSVEKELAYINKLLQLDKQYEKDYKYLFSQLHKQYDSKKLISEKLRLEKEVKNSKIKIGLSLLLSIILLGLLYFRTRKYKSKEAHYKKLLNEVSIVKIEEKSLDVSYSLSEEVLAHENNLGINPLVVEEVLKKLNDFERDKQFLKKEITLGILAKICATNTAYLSKIINHYKKVSFAEYLNNLRLEYIVGQWRTAPKSRLYTLQEIAEKAGYNSTQAFAKNFQEKYKMPPSNFLNNLNQKKLPVHK